ncbi:deoxyribonuclease IV [Paenibacillus athensensis]|uniref:Endonuclease IV n=1 Tax=Paenibacillus athensensis TaxID=1967502 RepID=A0A4Y8QCM8_9BACL|nr:deoxyribonuclease IV [Paenibacillus athensensis]MCD1257468.1 deoxyribonuclease IV [Paenibacillus athensensis]
MFIGAHVSTKAGYLGAAKAALQAGASAFQYFPMNPRALRTKSLNERDAAACAAFCREHGLLSIGHAPYALNPAADAEQRELMRTVLISALTIAEACGSVGLVVHFGKYLGKDPLQGYKNIIQLINQALGGWQGRCLLLLENQAGERGHLGTAMEEFVQVRKLCEEPERIGFCFDTCHAFASGLWSGNWPELAERGGALGYFQHVHAVHLNDSLYGAGSRRDRHAGIGTGEVGERAFAELLHSVYFRSIPIVMETAPGTDGTHRAEIARVKALAEGVVLTSKQPER